MDKRLLEHSSEKLISLLLKLVGSPVTPSFKAVEGEVHWSLYAGRTSLLEPKPHHFVYCVLLTSLLRALQENGPLLWATIASAATDRLPPVLFRLSVAYPTPFLPSHKNEVGLFALTETAFILRSHPPDWVLTVATFQAALADSLQLILDEVGDRIKDRSLQGKELYEAAQPVLQSHLALALPITGRGERSFHAFSAWLEKKTGRLFANILTEQELHHLYERKVQEYVEAMEKELQSPLLPEEVKKLHEQTAGLGWEAKGRVFCELIGPKMERR